MSNHEIELVIKIGSMALIRQEDWDIDYNIFSRLGAQLRPGMVVVSSGAVEIGRLDYLRRNGGAEPPGDVDSRKTDYSAQGQAILMQTYREYIHPAYSVRQLLVEHQHFNDAEKRTHIRNLLLRSAGQNAIPIINYNDAVSDDENRRLELTRLREAGQNESVVECIDNDETAAVIATLLQARILIVLTSTKGIYRVPGAPETLISDITGHNAEQVIKNMEAVMQNCQGSSREGSGGARAKLEFMREPVRQGTTVIIAHAQYRLQDILSGTVPRTYIGVI